MSRGAAAKHRKTSSSSGNTCSEPEGGGEIDDAAFFFFLFFLFSFDVQGKERGGKRRTTEQILAREGGRERSRGSCRKSLAAFFSKLTRCRGDFEQNVPA